MNIAEILIGQVVPADVQVWTGGYPEWEIDQYDELYQFNVSNNSGHPEKNWATVKERKYPFGQTIALADMRKIGRAHV